MVPCGKFGCATYKSQRSIRTQEESSDGELNPIGSSEGSHDPPYHQEETTK